MEIFIDAITSNEPWIYAFLGVFALWQLIAFSSAWQEMRAAGFGMERSIAQTKLNQAATMLVIALLAAVSVFMLVAFVAPTMPGVQPLPTPTLNLLAPTPFTADVTLAPSAGGQPLPATPQPTAGAGSEVGCIPGVLEITSPKNGDEVAGTVKIRGSVDIPNFGFYKYEIARPGDTVWLSINAGEKIIKDSDLGDWITDVLPPGEYLLRLMAADNQGLFLPPCVIRVNVLAPTPIPVP